MPAADPFDAIPKVGIGATWLDDGGRRTLRASFEAEIAAIVAT